MTRLGPVEAARRIAERRHPEALAAFVCGSVLTEHRTAYSDLDLVVVLESAPAPYRSSFVEADWPVEMFVHTEETWREFVERETDGRRSPLLFMCAQGELVVDQDGSGARLAAEARERVAAGPPPLTPGELAHLRYALTDLLDDLAGCTDPTERLFTVTTLAQRTAELALLVRGRWLGAGKWLARRLRAAEPALAERLEAAVRDALEARPEALVALVDEVLRGVGGRLWDGYEYP
ncbi:nucleotidyltransferase domain-containing protein [Streptomyces sp. PSKA54]|uniref:Nucleotidyltransferase domain-containing protein n=2 Tax=Streptomyces TaxID=1883 RepID=A0A7W2HJA8_9ACTN|nr:nucleotidyltransferase domain-containing protein [Streptomyces himalayensis subsp. aureolus]